MRLARLDLTRYGKFTDAQLDFGTKPVGTPDLHVVYGPNEAGKSTAFAAYLDLLYGIETRSPYNFQHAYSTMQIGGALELGGKLHDLRRLKRPQNSLLDSQDQPISEGLILRELGGIDREAYRNMFSLDDKTLEEGGESILASKGDLGQLLFSASAGLADFSKALLQIRAETDMFHRARARNTELHDFKEALARLKTERDALDTVASDYEKLLHTSEQAYTSYQEALGQRNKTRTLREQILRIINARPRMAELLTLRDQAAALAHLPSAPSHWNAEVPQLSTQEIKLSTRHDTLTAEIERHQGALEQIVVNRAALDAALQFELLTESRARFATAEQDIPNRQNELQQTQREIAFLLKNLGKENANAASLILTSATIARIHDLLESHSGLQAESARAQAELDAALNRYTEAEHKLAGSGNSTQNIELATLQNALSGARASDHAPRAKIAKAEIETQTCQLEIALRALLPWRGAVEDLLEMPRPSTQTLQKWKQDLNAARKKFDTCAAETNRLAQEIQRAQGELTAIRSIFGPIESEDAAKIRASREQAWAFHRHNLDQQTAEAFEAILRQDDATTAAIAAHSGELAKIQHARQTLLRIENEYNIANRAQETAKAELSTVLTTQATTVQKLSPSLPADIDITELEPWLAARDKAIEIHDKIHLATREMSAVQIERKTHETALSKALNAPAGVQFETLVQTCEETLVAQTALKALRGQLEDLARDLVERRKHVETSKIKLEVWHENWALVCSSCWLGEAGAIPDIAMVRAVLSQLSDLPSLIKDEANLLSRIDKMQHDQRKFAAEVAEFSDIFEVSGANPLQDYQIISKCVVTAKGAAQRFELEHKTLEEARISLEIIKSEITAHHRQKSQITSYFGVATLLEADEKLRLLEKRSDLRQQIAKLEIDIPNQLNVASFQEASDLLGSTDHTELEAELATLDAEFQLQDQRVQEAFRDHADAKKAIDRIGGDGAVARIEEQRRTILLEIEDKAKSYFSLRLGVHAAEQALRLYRDKHRSFMMARASEAFATISRGAYKRLATRPERDSEVLIGIGEKDSKDAKEMSKGTRFQLYLALRVAGYHEFVQTRRPVPFIADDIMETFDDDRAQETFRLFDEMATAGQVIYFTHHLHLCDIARKTCPGVQIHRL